MKSDVYILKNQERYLNFSVDDFLKKIPKSSEKLHLYLQLESSFLFWIQYLSDSSYKENKWKRRRKLHPNYFCSYNNIIYTII